MTSPSVSPDGSYFFFASDLASDGSCGIYWVDAAIVRDRGEDVTSGWFPDGSLRAFAAGRGT
jgi:Tol biopolymer transport system component